MKICDEIAFQKGVLEGEKKGIFEGKLETAKAMLLKGIDVDFIIEVTGLSKQDLEQLKH